MQGIYTLRILVASKEFGHTHGRLLAHITMSNMPYLNPRSLRLALLVLSLFGLSQAARALTNATATTNFTNLGNLGGANGVLIAPNWVLTAAHVAGNSTALAGSSFQSGDGSSTIDAAFVFDGTSNFPDNDIALVHLTSAINSSSLPILNDSSVNDTISYLGGNLTLASSVNSTQRDYGYATGSGEVQMYNTSTVNWIITSGSTNVVGGDSGSALYMNQVTDGAGQVLLGVASAETTTGNGVVAVNQSAYVLVSYYKTWIDTTIANSGLSGSNQTVQWVSAVPETSSVLAMLLGVGGLCLLGQKRRAR